MTNTSNAPNAGSAGIPAAFLAESRRNLLTAHARIEHCVNQLTDDQLWHRPNPQMNAIGNLLLHLAGNIGERITCAIYNTPSTRNRAAEFAARDPIPKSTLQAQLKTAVESAIAAIDSIKEKPSVLLETRRIQGTDSTVLFNLYRAVAHFEGHTQEIVAMTRILRGSDYQFLEPPKPSEPKSTK